MNQVQTIWKNPLKFVYDPILPQYMNQAKTIQKNPVKMQMTLLWPFGIKQFKIKIAYQKGLYLSPADLKYNTRYIIYMISIMGDHISTLSLH